MCLPYENDEQMTNSSEKTSKSSHTVRVIYMHVDNVCVRAPSAMQIHTTIYV